MVKLQLSIVAAALLTVGVVAQGEAPALLPNWVGPQKGKPIDKACYRKTYVTTTKECAVGYNFDKVTTCWTQCPIEYPVECGMECIPQNKDCTKEVLEKVASVATVALNAATAGVFGELTKAAKAVQVGVRCGEQLFHIVTKISGFIDELESGDAGDSTEDQIVFAVMKSDFAVYDLPAAVATCIGKPIPSGLTKSKEIVDSVKAIVDLVVNKKIVGVDLLDLATFVSALKEEVPAVSDNISESDQEAIQKLVGDGVSCGTDIYSIVNKIVASVQELKTKDPNSAVDVLKFALLQSDLVLKDLPEAASTCVDAATGYSKRDEILKTVHVIIDKVMEASSEDGKPLSTADYAMSVTNMGLDAIALFDPTGIAALAAEFIQPICGPTAFIGDIDSGPADKALGLTTMEKAFRNSTGTWNATGDGQLSITFASVDDKDVTVNVLSGGKKVDEVDVNAGETVEWTKSLAGLAGKTLYLDRWRAGLFGVSGTGGGSLLAWVPSHAATGSLTLDVKINPTSFSDHALRVRSSVHVTIHEPKASTHESRSHPSGHSLRVKIHHADRAPSHHGKYVKKSLQ